MNQRLLILFTAAFLGSASADAQDRTAPCVADQQSCYFSQSSLVVTDWIPIAHFFPSQVAGATATLRGDVSGNQPSNTLEVLTSPGSDSAAHGSWIAAAPNFATYGPRSLGPIVRLTFQEIMQYGNYATNANNQQYVYALIRQAGRDYVAELGSINRTLVLRDVTFSRVLVASDFSLIQPNGTLNTASHPDLSAAGDVLHFGIAHMSQAPAGASIGATIVWLKQWSVSIERGVAPQSPIIQ